MRLHHAHLRLLHHHAALRLLHHAALRLHAEALLRRLLLRLHAKTLLRRLLLRLHAESLRRLLGLLRLLRLHSEALRRLLRLRRSRCRGRGVLHTRRVALDPCAGMNARGEGQALAVGLTQPGEKISLFFAHKTGQICHTPHRNHKLYTQESTTA